jgi:sodium/potassium/calcium exchanger 6
LALFPICGSLFVLYTQDRNFYLVFKTTVWGWSVTGLLILFSVLAGVCFFCTSKRSVVPAYNDKLMALSFFMSILWIIAICGYMIDAISLLGVVLDMPVSFLGLTLLAWGNSAGDFVANPAITRLGMSQTAVTGCFAGPLFNTLIGFGVSLIVVCSNKNVKFQITDHGQLLIAAAALICTNSLSCYIILKSRGKLRSWYGYTLGGIYFLFFIIVLIYTL